MNSRYLGLATVVALIGVVEEEPSTAQLMPSSAVLSAMTSTMIASTSTCARRISSLSTICMIDRIIFGTDAPPLYPLKERGIAVVRDLGLPPDLAGEVYRVMTGKED